MIKIDSKIKTISEAKIWRAQLEKNNLKLAFTNGCFDILHRGHVEYLYNARLQGDKLVIALNSDVSVQSLKGPGRPINSEYDRALIIASLFFVDAVVIFNNTRCNKIISELSPDIYVKGGDYNVDNIDESEKKALLEAGSKMAFISLTEGYSTTSVIKKAKN